MGILLLPNTQDTGTEKERFCRCGRRKTTESEKRPAIGVNNSKTEVIEEVKKLGTVTKMQGLGAKQQALLQVLKEGNYVK